MVCVPHGYHLVHISLGACLKVHLWPFVLEKKMGNFLKDYRKIGQ